MTLYFKEAPLNTRQAKKKAAGESLSPVRRCVVCGKREWKYDLLKLTISKSGKELAGSEQNLENLNVRCDFKQQGAGRGWYVHSQGSCLGAKGFSDRLFAAVSRMRKFKSDSRVKLDNRSCAIPSCTISRSLFELSAICDSSAPVFSQKDVVPESLVRGSSKPSVRANMRASMRAKRRSALEQVEKRTWEVLKVCMPEWAKKESLKVKPVRNDQDSGKGTEKSAMTKGRNIRL